MPKLVEICRVDHEVSTPRCAKARTRGAGLGVRAGLASCDSVQIMFHLALPVNTRLSRTLTGWQVSPDKCASRQTAAKGHPDFREPLLVQGKPAGKKEIHYFEYFDIDY